MIKIKQLVYENDRSFIDFFEPHSDEILTSDQGYIDVAKQIESMMLAGQLLQESRPNTRNLNFDYDNDDSAFSDYDDPAAVDRRGSDIVDITREADNLRERLNNAYRKALEAKPIESESKELETKSEVTPNE